MEYKIPEPIDIVAIEMDARRMRAEVLANGVGRLVRRINQPFQGRRNRHA